MKLKKFNESDDPEPIDKTKIDPWGEEDWDDKKITYSETPGCCYNCGSNNINYDSTEYYDNSIGYEYTCNDCNSSGVEVYDLTFVVNESN